MTVKNYITASCTISDHTVYKNGNAVFKNKGTDLHAFLLSLYQYLGLKYPRFYKMDNLSKLGWLASEVLLKDSFQVGEHHPEETGIILSNANSSLDTDITYTATIKQIPSPSVFVYTLPNIVTGEICIRNNFKGENAFFIFEHFDADFMEHYVNSMLNNGILQVCICGWVELLENNYKAALFLIEKGNGGQADLFTKYNINQLFQAENI